MGPLNPQEYIAKWSCPEPTTGCWLWTGHLQKDGYGKIYFERKRQLAHRISYRVFHGHFDLKMHVLHRCDTPACVNPEHLFLGTQTDNMKDMCRKGRHAKTALGHGLRAITHKQLDWAIEQRKHGRTYSSIADHLRAGHGTIYALLKRRGL